MHLFAKKSNKSIGLLGFTLIELLIVVGIVSLLLQLALPAVEMSREAARRTSCANNLRQIGIGVLQHELNKNHYPSGGWHFTWVGEPERGTDATQPGSWAFNTLDYVEQHNLRSMASNLNGKLRHAAIKDRVETPIPLFICPSRRFRSVFLYTDNQLPYTKGGQFQTPLEFGAKTDYAANSGDGHHAEFHYEWEGPLTLEGADDRAFSWPKLPFSGVIFGRSEVRNEQVTDGTTNTYLLGEKYVENIHYKTGEDAGDNESLYVGFNNDTCRVAGVPPQRDRDYVAERIAFGSNHPNVWLAVMCDGSVQQLTFDIEIDVHGRLATIAGTEITGIE